MAWLDFLRKGKGKTPPAQPVPTATDNKALWESPDAIYIGDQHIYGGPGMAISCEVKYVPSKRTVVCKTTSTSDTTPRYETLAVPDSVGAADDLVAYVKKARGAWLVLGYEPSELLKEKLTAAFHGKA